MHVRAARIWSLRQRRAGPRPCAELREHKSLKLSCILPQSEGVVSVRALPQKAGHAWLAHSCQDVLSWQQCRALHGSLLEAQPLAGQHAGVHPVQDARLCSVLHEHLLRQPQTDACFEQALSTQGVICCACFVPAQLLTTMPCSQWWRDILSCHERQGKDSFEWNPRGGHMCHVLGDHTICMWRWQLQAYSNGVLIAEARPCRRQVLLGAGHSGLCCLQVLHASCKLVPRSP